MNKRYEVVKRLTRERVRKWRKKHWTELPNTVKGVPVSGLDTPVDLKVPKGSKHRPVRKLGAVLVW